MCFACIWCYGDLILTMTLKVAVHCFHGIRDESRNESEPNRISAPRTRTEPNSSNKISFPVRCTAFLTCIVQMNKQVLILHIR